MANDLEQVQVAPNKHQLAQTSGSSRRPVSAGAYVLAEPSPTARWNPAAHLNESQLGASRARIEPNNEVDNFVSSRGHSSDASGQQGDNNSGVQDGARPGAVMGIFFKVWSLVKVTKGRNQAHKMRRQTSAEPSQLRGSPSWPVEQEHGLITGKTAPITRLKDDHFRRAGSQPAPSVRARSGQANMLQVKSTTGSTSSGVSSATSGDGAFSSPGAGRSSSSAVRRHLSAYSLRRSTADTPLSGPNAVLSDGSTSPTGTGQKERSLSGSASSWASRIKRSATTVNQADLSSYVSKYKFKRVHEQPDSAAPLIKHQHSPPAPPVPAQAHTRRATIPPPESELGQAAEAGATKARRLTTVSASTGSASDLDDSNDIYSTPHDSVQSVPSSAPLYPMSERIAPTVHQVTSQAYPIIKSFSTSNFGQLLAGTRQQLAIGPGQFKPIAELDSAARQVELDNELPDAPAKVDGSAPARGSRRHMANSRFFISSSSSEDSTSGQHQQKAAGPGSSTPAHQVESQGSHYHAAARPDSLILAQPSLVGTQALMSPLDWSAPSPFVRRPSRSFRPLEPTQISAGPKRPSLVSSGLTQFPTTKCGPVVARDPAVAPSHDSGRLNLAEPQAMPAPPDSGRKRPSTLINSVSLYDCKLPALANLDTSASGQHDSEYRLANMLLEFGSNPHVKDENGNTVLMHACLSDNLSTVRCLLERNVDPDEENNDKLTALDLVCSKESSACRLSILDLLIENKANVDRQDATGLRLLDRLVAEHQPGVSNKLPYIECLLRNGAKLGSSTWAAAAGKHDVQLRLLKKLCHDGYFLYKQSSIEAAVYRFEYALRRIAELEQQLVQGIPGISWSRRFFYQQQVGTSVRQIKFQTFLGLSRCERKRKFYKRALEFAHMSILVDSTAYEGFYSKANILKDLGETDEALLAVNQTSRLLDQSIELTKSELAELDGQQEESYMLLDVRQATGSSLPSSSDYAIWRQELTETLNYLEEAQKHIVRLKAEILDDKLSSTTTATSKTTTSLEAQADTLPTQADEIAIQTRC